MKSFTYDLEADWITNSLCNFSCDYCDAENAKEAPGVFAYSLEHYVNFFSRYGRWMLHMSGGEPLIHVQTVHLIRALTEAGHYVSLNTNGSQTARIRLLADTVSPDSVEYIHIGVHPVERTRKNAWSALLENLRTLKSSGFEVFGSIVMSPWVFGDNFTFAREQLASVGVTVIPKAMRIPDFGPRHPELFGKRYPQEYTEKQRTLFREYAEEAARQRPDLVSSHATINPMQDIDYIEGFPNFRQLGSLCDAGRLMFKIDEVGKIWRCGRETQHGDIGLNELRFNDGPVPCNSSFCAYYCLKYSDHLVSIST